MRMYITSRFDGSADNKAEIEELCLAVRSAGMDDFHAIRDVDNYQPGFFKDVKELWFAARKYIDECDALLVDISDSPSGGRLVEIGIAYALNKPICVIMKNNMNYKDFYNGVADIIIKYDKVSEITDRLKHFESSLTD